MDNIYEKFGAAFSRFIFSYNAKLVFAKDVPFQRPLDREGLGNSAIRNVLFKLDGNGPMTMTALADLVNYDRGNMSKLAEKLEGMGYARRFRMDGDRRVVYIELTEKGQALMNAEADTFLKNAAYLMGRNLTQEELERFLGVLTETVNFLEKM